MTHTARRTDTTDLEEVRERRARFTWGKVVAFHDIGRYTLIEYHGREDKDGRATGNLEEKTSFHIYVDGRSMSSSASSLESGLIHAIALGKLEVNHAHHMTTACLKILELQS